MPLIAVLPIENLSGSKAPVKVVRQAIMTSLREHGASLLDDDRLEDFMAAHFIRYTGAVDLETTTALKKETGAGAVLITSLELYDEKNPPKIALISRLVSTGDKPEILWMHSAGLSGDDTPKLLGLGLIEDPQILLTNAVQMLTGSLARYMSGTEEAPVAVKKNTGLQPKAFYRSPLLTSDMKYRVAIMPFLNKSDRKNAGDIMALHFTEQLRGNSSLNVIEPGLIRQNLLAFRVIMNEGMSFENAGLIFNTLETDADLILSGTVMDYQDYENAEGTPKVDFSVLVIEKKSREVVWTSKSYNRGDEGVLFFDRGKINTAHALASKMAEAVAEMMTQRN